MTSSSYLKQDDTDDDDDDGNGKKRKSHGIKSTLPALEEVNHLPSISLDEMKRYIHPETCDDAEPCTVMSSARYLIGMYHFSDMELEYNRLCSVSEITDPNSVSCQNDNIFEGRSHRDHIDYSDLLKNLHEMCPVDDCANYITKCTDQISFNAVKHDMSDHCDQMNNNFRRNGFLPDLLVGSSCSSPPVTPPYLNTTDGLCTYLSNPGDMENGFYDIALLRNRLKQLPTPSLGNWEAVGDATHIGVISKMGPSIYGRASFAAVRHRNDDTIFQVGDVMLLRRPTQEWFDRSPLVMEVLSIHCDLPLENDVELGTLSVKLRRYYRTDQVSCALPDIALEMASREAVIFSSDSSSDDELTSECSFEGRGLVLSIGEYYRFWAELTRRRHGRTSRRCPTTLKIQERWQDWMEKPETVFVVCGHYDPNNRELEEI